MLYLFKILFCTLGLTVPSLVAAEPFFNAQVEYKLDYSNLGCTTQVTPTVFTPLNPSVLAWVMPSVHYLLNEKASQHYHPSLYGMSIGAGCRYLLMPQWVLGLYAYHDVDWFKIMPQSESNLRNVVNFGLESLWPACKTYFNFYVHPIERHLHPKAADFKLSIPLSHRLSVFGGSYYHSAAFGKEDSCYHIEQPTARVGYALGVKYHFDHHWHFEAQYMNNIRFNEYYWTMSLKKILGADTQKPCSLLNQSIERNFANPLLVAAPDPIPSMIPGRISGDFNWDSVPPWEIYYYVTKQLPLKATWQKYAAMEDASKQLLHNIVLLYFSEEELSSNNHRRAQDLKKPQESNYQARLPLLGRPTIEVKSDFDNSQSTPLDKLPNELLEQIFSYLPVRNALSLRLVSKKIHLLIQEDIKHRLIPSHRTTNVAFHNLYREIRINQFALKPKYMILEENFTHRYIDWANNLKTSLNKKQDKTQQKKILAKILDIMLHYKSGSTVTKAALKEAESSFYLYHASVSAQLSSGICYFPEFYNLLDCSNINTLIQLASLNYLDYHQSYNIEEGGYCPINIASLIFRNKTLYEPILQLPDCRYPLYYFSMMALNSPPQAIMQELRYDPTVFDFIMSQYNAYTSEQKEKLFTSRQIRDSLNLLGDFLKTIEDYPTAFSLNQLIEQSQKTGAPLKWNYPESLERVAVRERCSWMLSWEKPCALEEFEKSIQIPLENIL